MAKQFVGNYRVACRYVQSMAKHLASAWPTMANGQPASRKQHVVECIHHVQPRRKSVYLALLVVRELLNNDPGEVRAFIDAMEFKDKRRTRHADKNGK